MGRRITDADGRDVTRERTTVIPAGSRAGEKVEKGEWMRLDPVEVEMVRRFRAAKAERATQSKGYKR